MECGVYPTGVHCQSERTVGGYFAQVAELQPDGSVTFCSTHSLRHLSCNLGNAGEHAPRLGYGRTVSVGPFRCGPLRRGIRCTVISSGRGFLLTRSGLLAVGGAIVRPAPLHLSGFLSPTRKVWCAIGEGRQAFCGAGQTTQGMGYPSAQADFDPDGTVHICFIAHEAEAPLLHGVPQGCLQNWDSAAPILPYGQASELEGVRCTSAIAGITCVSVTGASKGKGFRVCSSEAVDVVGAPRA
jgi:hypothetical protein